MDYGAFYKDVLEWISQANQAAMQHGMQSERFWAWVAASVAAICDKHQEHRLAHLQMRALVDWLEEVCEGQKVAQ